MRILGIVGSPRSRGNTCDMVDAVLDGARKNDADTSLITLGQKTIRECMGCHHCWNSADCVHEDDMISLYHEIERSDAVVFGTPVYWYGPTAVMKTFLDRFVYYNCPENRRKVKGKYAVLVSPFEEDTNDTAAPLVDMFERSFNYLELHHVGTVLAPGAGVKGDVRRMTEVLERCSALGWELAERGRKVSGFDM